MTRAFPKPSEVRKKKEPVKVLAGGRQVCDLKTKAGMDIYRGRVKTMLVRQGGKCGLMITDECRRKQGRLAFDMATFDHSDGRAAGKRDDRIEVLNPETGKLEPINMAVCGWCNSRKGSQPLSAFLNEQVIP